MNIATVPIDTMVPISKFSKGSASAEFAKVRDGVPVTVLKNSEPAYFIINYHDYTMYKEMENALHNLQARYDAENHIGESFDSLAGLFEDLNA